MERRPEVLATMLACANDLGFFAEGADPGSRRTLGNVPQTFMHAAFVGAAVDYRDALEY